MFNEFPLRLLFIPMLFFALQPVEGQEVAWARQAGGSHIDHGSAIAVDTSGNSYVTGHFTGTATFGEGEPNETNLSSTGSSLRYGDILVAKYHRTGNLEWARQAGGTQRDRGLSIAVDASGNSYLTGSFFGLAAFGAGESNETFLYRPTSADIFVSKYDSDGDLVWVKQAGGRQTARGWGIAVDASEHIYVTGVFVGSATFGKGEINETTLTSTNYEGIFVAHYGSSGELLWARQASGPAIQYSGKGIAVDASGNSYVTGYFTGSATFGAGETNATTLHSDGSGDIFVAKYNSSGELAWAERAGGVADDGSEAIAVDRSGNSCVTGYFEHSATFGEGRANGMTLNSFGPRDIFVAKYNSSGELLWVRQAGGAAWGNSGRGIAADALGECHLTGYFSDSTTFG